MCQVEKILEQPLHWDVVRKGTVHLGIIELRNIYSNTIIRRSIEALILPFISIGSV